MRFYLTYKLQTLLAGDIRKALAKDNYAGLSHVMENGLANISEVLSSKDLGSDPIKWTWMVAYQASLNRLSDIELKINFVNIVKCLVWQYFHDNFIWKYSMENYIYKNSEAILNNWNAQRIQNTFTVSV